MLYFGMILGLPPFWETFMRFPCCWVFIGGYTNKLPSKIGDWTKLDGRNSKTCFLHPQDHSTLSQGFRCFFLLHCHRWLSHFQVNVGNPMGIPRSYGLWWSQYGWYHRPAFRTFLKCSAEYLHPNVKTPKVLTCQSGWYRYNMLQHVTTNFYLLVKSWCPHIGNLPHPCWLRPVFVAKSCNIMLNPHAGTVSSWHPHFSLHPATLQLRPWMAQRNEDQAANDRVLLAFTKRPVSMIFPAIRYH
jgi:hypothetical protein